MKRSRNISPNSLRAAKENAKRFWTDPELIKKNIEGRKSKLFQETHKAEHLRTPEMTRKAIEAARNSPKYWEARVASAKKNLHTPEAEARARQSRASSDAAKAAYKRMRAALAESEICKKGPKNHAARMWHLRSPSNVEYHIKNLAHFIRDNKNLFPEDDTERIIHRGIGMLRPSDTRKRVPGSWKGWTWISLIEVFNNNGDDILERQTNETLTPETQDPTQAQPPAPKDRGRLSLPQAEEDSRHVPKAEEGGGRVQQAAPPVPEGAAQV